MLSCIPYTDEGAEALAASLNDGTTADEARSCEPGGSRECCGPSTCVDNRCQEICRLEGEQCFNDRECQCQLGETFHCVAEPSNQSPSPDVPADPRNFRNTCQNTQPIGFPPICIMFNEDMFAIRFFPALIPLINVPGKKWPCSLIDGIPFKIIKLNLLIGLQFSGIGIVHGSRFQFDDETKPNLRYGSSAITGSEAPNQPVIYDGLTNIPLQVDGIDFWISLTFKFKSLSQHYIDRAACAATDSDEDKPELSLWSKFEAEGSNCGKASPMRVRIRTGSDSIPISRSRANNNTDLALQSP